MIESITFKCPACEQVHHEHPVHKLERPRSGATHWCECPVFNEPVFLLLGVMDSGPVDPEVCEWLREAQQAGKYFVAVSRVQDGQVFKPHWKTCQWPVGDFPFVLRELKAVGDQLLGVKDHEPLPRATPPVQRIVPGETSIAAAIRAARGGLSIQDDNGDDKPPQLQN